MDHLKNPPGADELIKEGTTLSTNQIFTKMFKHMYILIGFQLGGRKCRAAFIVFCLKLSCVLLSSLYNNYIGRHSAVSIANKAAWHLIPLAEFCYLYLNIYKLDEIINRFLSESRAKTNECALFLKKMRFVNIICSSLIVMQWAIYFLAGVSSLQRVRGFIIMHTFHVDIGVNKSVEAAISCVMFVYQAFVENYIALSTSLYLSYFKIISYCKSLTLDQIECHTIRSLHRKLNSLDDLMTVFESTLSSLPLIWLYHGIGPGLIYLYAKLAGESSGKPVVRTIEAMVLSLYLSVNAIITLASLFFLSRWHEETDMKCDMVVRSLQERAQSPQHFCIIERIKKSIARPPTVYLVCPINRSLILAYIGSAITFSTLIIQLQK